MYLIYGDVNITVNDNKLWVQLLLIGHIIGEYRISERGPTIILYAHVLWVEGGGVVIVAVSNIVIVFKSLK